MTTIDAPTEEPTDPELISRVRGGDVDAYGSLFARHVDAATRLARTIGGSDADDLVSEAFTKVLNVLLEGGGPDVAFRAYLLTAVRRLHVDRIRSGRRLTTTDDLTPYDKGEPFTDPAVAGFEGGAAAKAFMSLPERWQMVLWHLEVENQKPADIAPLLGISANSVSALAYRAREGLRQAFLNMHAGDLVEDECRAIHTLLGAHVRGGLAKRDAAKVDEHLDQCRKCTAVYLELTEVNSSLAAVLGPALLGTAALGYLGNTTGSLSGVGLVAERLKDFLVTNSQAAIATAAAAAIAAVATVGVLAARPGPAQQVAGPRPPTQSAPVVPPAQAPSAPRPDRPAKPPATPPATVAPPVTNTTPPPVVQNAGHQGAGSPSGGHRPDRPPVVKPKPPEHPVVVPPVDPPDPEPPVTQPPGPIRVDLSFASAVIGLPDADHSTFRASILFAILGLPVGVSTEIDGYLCDHDSPSTCTNLLDSLSVSEATKLVHVRSNGISHWKFVLRAPAGHLETNPADNSIWCTVISLGVGNCSTTAPPDASPSFPAGPPLGPSSVPSTAGPEDNQGDDQTDDQGDDRGDDRRDRGTAPTAAPAPLAPSPTSSTTAPELPATADHGSEPGQDPTPDATADPAPTSTPTLAPAHGHGHDGVESPTV